MIKLTNIGQKGYFLNKVFICFPQFSWNSEYSGGKQNPHSFSEGFQTCLISFCFPSSAPYPAACSLWWRCSTPSPGSTPSSPCCPPPCWTSSAVPPPSWWGCCPARCLNSKSCPWKRWEGPAFLRLIWWLNIFVFLLSDWTIMYLNSKHKTWNIIYVFVLYFVRFGFSCFGVFFPSNRLWWSTLGLTASSDRLVHTFNKLQPKPKHATWNCGLHVVVNVINFLQWLKKTWINILVINSFLTVMFISGKLAKLGNIA